MVFLVLLSYVCTVVEFSWGDGEVEGSESWLRV